MRRNVWVCSILVLATSLLACAEKFVTFPESKELPSPDGKFVVRNFDRGAQASSEIVGAFHALVLEERATGKTRRLLNYVRRVAVAWAPGNLLIVTDYVSKRSARAIIFAADNSFDPIVIDKVALERAVPEALRFHLMENDHVYIEASRLDGKNLIFRVWGYGPREPGGFRFLCGFNLDQSTVSCRETGPQP